MIVLVLRQVVAIGQFVRPHRFDAIILVRDADLNLVEGDVERVQIVEVGQGRRKLPGDRIDDDDGTEECRLRSMSSVRRKNVNCQDHRRCRLRSMPP